MFTNDAQCVIPRTFTQLLAKNSNHPRRAPDIPKSASSLLRATSRSRSADRTIRARYAQPALIRTVSVDDHSEERVQSM